MTTGPALAAKMVMGLGLQRAWRVAKLVHRAKETPGSVNVARRRFLRQSGALLVALPLLGGPALRQRFMSVASGNQDWTVYRDPDFGFTLQYPAGWQVETKEEQPTPLIDDEAILKRVIFSSIC